jgi:hypothetical protein
MLTAVGADEHVDSILESCWDMLYSALEVKVPSLGNVNCLSFDCCLRIGVFPFTRTSLRIHFPRYNRHLNLSKIEIVENLLV